MALIKCSECGKEISDKAKKCPHCGFKINDRTDKNNNVFYKKINIILYIVIVLNAIQQIIKLLLISIRYISNAKKMPKLSLTTLTSEKSWMQFTKTKQYDYGKRN